MEEMITEGKQFKTLEIYKKYFRAEKKYSGIVIFEKLLRELELILQQFPVQ